MAEQTQILAGGYQPPTSVHTRAMRVVQSEIASRAGGAAALQFTENVMDSGHNAADLLTMTESGALSLCYFSTSYLADRVPEFGLLDLPFVFRERGHAYRVLDGPVGAQLTARLEETTGFRLLGFWDNGFRHLTNRVHSIRQPEDCTGLVIRTLFSEMHQRAFALMGFEPRPLDVKDLLTAVAEGTIDAHDNALTNIFNFKIYEQHPYITLSSHFFGAAAVLAHGETMATWSPELRAAVVESVAVATTAQRALAAAEDAVVLERLSAHGNQVHTLTGEEHAAFVESVRPLLEEQRARFGGELFDLVVNA